MLAAFVSGFVLFLREGLEACLIVSILLAALRQLGQTRHIRAVWIGVIAALFAAIAGAAVIYRTISQYDGSRFQTIFETITYIVAVLLLTGMTFWMQLHSRTLKKEITEKASIASSGFAFGLLAFSTVGREGLETAVFALAFAFKDGLMLLLGGAFGVAAAIALCFMIYRLGYRLDFRLFFRTLGILLLFFAAGLLGDAIQNLQELRWVSFGSTPVWNTTHILAEDSVIGDVLHTIFGYAQSPSFLQVACYVAFLAITGTIFWSMTRRRPQSPPAASSAPMAASPAPGKQP